MADIAQIIPIPQGVVVQDYEALVSVVIGDDAGWLRAPVMKDTTDEAIKTMVTEALRTGGVEGVPAQNTNITGFAVYRANPTEVMPHATIMLAPKTALG